MKDISTPARRLGAHILDVLIWWIIIFIGFGSKGTTNIGRAILGAIIILGGIVLLFYMWGRSTSPGKFLLGMKVYNKDDEQPVSFFMMLLRETLGKFVSGLFLCLGYIWILIDHEKQGWHDKLIGSIVVNEKES